MQFTNSDGSIVLSVKVDQSGLNKGMSSMKSGVSSISKQFKALGGTIATVFSIKAVWDFSKAAGQAATQTEASVQRLIEIYGEASTAVGDFIDYNARAIGMSRSAAASFASVYGNLFSVWADQKTNAELSTQYLNMTAVVASKTGRTVADVQERVRSGLLGNTEAIEDLGVFVNVKTIEMTDAFKRLADGRSWEQLGAYEQQQVRTLAILEQATARYGNQVAETTALTRARYQAAYEDFKATWGTVVNYVLMPVLKVATQIFNVLTKGLQVIAGLSGKTIDTSVYKEQENAIGGAADNQKALTDEMKKTAKEQKKLLAGFDDLQILSQNTSGADTGATAGTAGIGSVGDILGSGGGDASGTVEKISATLAAIMGVVGGAMVALGVLLLFHGHIGWGIGFIIAGAATMGVSMAALSQTEDGEGAIRMLTTIMGVVGGALIAIGIMLLYLGVGTLPVAIGMIIAGSASLIGAVGAMAAFSPNDVKGWLSLIMGIAGGALLALGIILCMVGSTPIGVGMIIAGSVALVSAVALNFNSVTDKIKGWVAVIMAIVGGAVLALGIILCATGVGVPLGIALIVAGAIALATPIALNWGFIKDKAVEIFNSILNWIKTWGLLVLGIILCVSGVGIPLGIALMKKGGANLTEAQDPLWTTIVDKVKEIWGQVKAFWNAHIAKYFTKEWWAGLGKKMMNGLISMIESGINKILSKFHSANIGKAIDFIAGGLGFDVPKSITIPRLARGAVIPPNREFLAVLGDQKHGTNIEAPAELIKQMAMEAMLEVGMTGQTTKEEHYYLGETELMSILYKLVKGGERLKGPSLISGGGY